MSLKVGVVLLCVALIAAGAPSPGSVNANGSFKLNGVEVPASAAASTPFNFGDGLSTDAFPAVLRLDAYGLIITVTPHSRIESGEFNGKPFIRLQDGSLEYQFVNPGTVQIKKRGETVAADTSGIVTITGHKKEFIALGAGAGGAAAVVTAVALVSRSASCPTGETCK